MNHKKQENYSSAYFKTRELAEQTFILWAQLGLILLSLGIAFAGLIKYIQTERLKPIIGILAQVLGHLFIITGFICTFFSLIQYRNKLNNSEKIYISAIDLPLLLGVTISIFGIITFIAMLIDWF